MARAANDLMTPIREGGSIQKIERPDPSVTPTDDGGAVVRIDESNQAKGGKEGFYDNLVTKFPEAEMTTLASTLIEDIDRDKKARERRDKEYAEAVRRTGLGKEAPGGAEFDGASRVVHPVMMEASVDFASRAIKELMPPGGPVKTYIPAPRPTKARLDKAERKKAYMNWQFMTQMPEFRPALEQMLPQVGLAGSQYMRLTPDAGKRRARATPQYVPSDKVHIPYAAANFYSAERQTFEEDITRLEFEERVRAKMYHFVGKPATSQMPETTDAQRATDRVEGKTDADYYNTDGLRTVYECSTFLDLEKEREGVSPYLVSIDKNTRKIVAIVRNWEEEDEELERMQWMVEFPFIPWRGAYSVGLGQMIGSLSGAATGALRALLDSAHVNNIPTFLRLKGANFSGQSKDIAATTGVEVDGGVGADDIRKFVMALPFNEPSPVLFSLLGFCVDAAKGVVRTTFEELAENNKDLPVGTTLAMIEQGMVVASAIHLRLCDSMTNVIRILHRIDKMYLTEDEVKDDTGDIMAYRSDFMGPLDVVPTADPQVFSDVQRIAQAQIVADRALVNPQLYNLRATELMLLERAKIADPESLLVPEQKAEAMNAVNENAAMCLGRPVSAFPEQDHLAHLQVHLDFGLSPVLGMLPNVAPAFQPANVEHIKEHVALWYVSDYFKTLEAALGGDEENFSKIMGEDDPDTRAELDRLLADLSPDIVARAGETLGRFPEIVSQALQVVAQYAQPPQIPTDPNKMAETERKKQDDANKARLKEMELQQKAAAKQQDSELELRKVSAEQRQAAIESAREDVRAAEDRVARLVELQAAERAEDERTDKRLASEERRNTQDNTVAMRIAAAELETDENTAMKTGTGINPNPSASS